VVEFAFLDHPGPIPFAHRGGAGEWPENTMPAFEGAVRLGYRYVETDVHVTSDGALLAFHDDVLDRVTDHEGDIAKLPWEVVRTARVGGREPIPLLEELLGTFPDLHVNIDPKHDAAVVRSSR
jgi:glycerophosphoryl diester phosphodiesterase